MKIAIEIELGNAEMQTPADVADALSDLIGWLDQRGSVPFESGDSPKRIRDVNGNTVGQLRVVATGKFSWEDR